ncbi:TonB-dependent receptor [Epilithonimonas ginsengisoli]|uniref:TonB-dependent receptor n=1 Tax=Epilithonimonas ginsengisoli TaxID=1245592 RepID=A0ABU4JFA0_9FLAO|nr:MULTISPECIES: TonB-dependent receptor [Chryseobacterium group]MBV6879667.1 TonB-dependent receptor [Epilithonimonas sp. FP105]MDW8548304.1 TonB-dependent receptor [Epilithonimonas ginsengisoli]OAH72541.1 ligand-gated channel protein [Chryseobacterium sp. FP211-J200]
MVTRFTSRFYKTAVAIFVTASSFCFSQSKNDTVKETEIVKVDVYRKNFKEILPAQTLSSEQLERLNSHSVADALRYFSGVQIKDYGGIGGLKTINIRSMGSQHIGVFYDGIQLGNAQNGVVDLGRFSLDDIEEVSLYNGQKSEIFQPAKDFGSSGSIYLQPKTPAFKLNKKTNLVLRLKNSSIDLFNPSFRLEQKISDKISASFSSEFLQSDGIYRFRYYKKYPDGALAYDTIAKRFDSDIKAKRFETSFHGILNNGSWNVRGYGYISDRGIPAAIVNNRFDGRGQRLVDDNYFVQANFKKRLFPKLETQLKAKFAYDFTHYIDTVSSIKIQNQYIQREIYLSSSNIYNVTQNWDVSASFDFQYNNLDADLVNFSYPTRYTSLLAFATTYQWKKLKFLGSVLGTFVHEDVEKNAKSPDKTEWTPAAFLSYQPFDSNDFTLRAFYKRIFRMPTFNDLYYTMIGNAFLEPEFTNQYNLGFTYQKSFQSQFFQSFYAKVDGYFNKVENKIIAAPTGNMFRWMMLNLGEVEIIGTDVNVQADLLVGNVKLKPLLSYTFQRARDFSDRNETYFGDQIPYTPWHSGTFSLMSDYKDWSFNYSFMYVGERYDGQQNNIQYNYIQPWYTHDLSIQKKMHWENHQFKASFEVNNIFNQYYDVVLNYPMPGRNFKLILSFTL